MSLVNPRMADPNDPDSYVLIDDDLAHRLIFHKYKSRSNPSHRLRTVEAVQLPWPFKTDGFHKKLGGIFGKTDDWLVRFNPDELVAMDDHIFDSTYSPLEED